MRFEWNWLVCLFNFERKVTWCCSSALPRVFLAAFELIYRCSDVGYGLRAQTLEQLNVLSVIVILSKWAYCNVVTGSICYWGNWLFFGNKTVENPPGSEICEFVCIVCARGVHFVLPIKIFLSLIVCYIGLLGHSQLIGCSTSPINFNRKTVNVN